MVKRWINLNNLRFECKWLTLLWFGCVVLCLAGVPEKEGDS